MESFENVLSGWSCHDNYSCLLDWYTCKGGFASGGGGWGRREYAVHIPQIFWISYLHDFFSNSKGNMHSTCIYNFLVSTNR